MSRSIVNSYGSSFCLRMGGRWSVSLPNVGDKKIEMLPVG